ncbi:MAG: DNA adenine methylase [Gammaproteobacteria bacterium]|nr:DNA adenine methylase [Gammaproteobacteria bacterium]
MSSSRPVMYPVHVERKNQSADKIAEPIPDPIQEELFDGGFPVMAERYPQLRFMGSKYRLLPWIHKILSGYQFETAIDAFSGSGCVGYLFKAMGKQVVTNDFLNLSTTVAKALIENPGHQLSEVSLEQLLTYDPRHKHFIERTFSGIFYTPEDLRFLDRVSWNINKLGDAYERAIALAALIRSCVKRQPRGVFTIAGDPEHYKDGRRDLKLSLQEHFLEQVDVYNEAAFDNGQPNVARHGDIFAWDGAPADLVYMDPPYVPRADDNCYMKRYHFLEGLSCYWEGKSIMEDSRVKKIDKPFTPFSYRRTAIDAFDQLFRKFADSTLVLSYSSNGYPDLAELRQLMRRYKQSVDVFERAHRYHFGTHSTVKRAQVQEYLIIGY